MGDILNKLRNIAIKISFESPIALWLSGLFITIFLVGISGLAGWLIERIALSDSLFVQLIGAILAIITLASALAARSLRQGVCLVLNALSENTNENELNNARFHLAKIVGRDVSELNEEDVLRAAAESASENSVDGVFAPLFWMFIGAALWQISSDLPGPLALAFFFKASSTIDSMIGYKTGQLRWLGNAGAKLDDFLTWIPCRIVLITLPLVSKPLPKMPSIINAALQDGSHDESPNSGISEAIFAYCAGIKMGGVNYYQGIKKEKPLLARHAPIATPGSIKTLLNLSLKLELLWLTIFLFISLILKAYLY